MMPEVCYRRLSFKGGRNPDRFFFFFNGVFEKVQGFQFCWTSTGKEEQKHKVEKGEGPDCERRAEWFWFSLLGDSEILRKV